MGNSNSIKENPYQRNYIENSDYTGQIIATATYTAQFGVSPYK